MKKQFGAIFQQGLHHMQHDTRCQDRAIAVQDNDLIVLALADGMGSYEYADLGAQFAVSYIREKAHKIHDLLEKENFRNGLTIFLQKLEDSAKEYARRIGITIDDMHCTLSFAVIGPEKMIQVAIGSCPIYAKTKYGLEFIYGNEDVGVGNISHSAYDITRSVRTMAVNVGFTKDLEAILMMSDGCLGDAEEDELNQLGESFPEWFEDVASGKISKKAAVQALVDKGYDDCSFAYYFRHAAVSSAYRRGEPFVSASLTGSDMPDDMEDTSRTIKDTLGKFWKDTIVVTGIMYDGTPIYDVAENDLLPGELAAKTFTVGYYTVRSAQRVYRITSEDPADEAEVSLVKEHAGSGEICGFGFINSMFSPWSDKLRIAHEISAKHNADSNGVFTPVCRATHHRCFSWTEQIGTICSVKEEPAISDKNASLLVNSMYMGSSFSVGSWYKLDPDGTITKLTLHPFDSDPNSTRFC